MASVGFLIGAGVRGMVGLSKSVRQSCNKDHASLVGARAVEVVSRE